MLEALADHGDELGAGDPRRFRAFLRAAHRLQFDHVVIVARGRDRRAVEAFHPLGLAAPGAESGGDVVGDVDPADRQRLQADEHPAGEDGDVRHPRPQLDQRHTQLALLVTQTCLAGGNRRGDDGFNAQVRGSDA